jgi:hypothetical protein
MKGFICQVLYTIPIEFLGITDIYSCLFPHWYFSEFLRSPQWDTKLLLFVMLVTYFLLGGYFPYIQPCFLGHSINRDSFWV